MAFGRSNRELSRAGNLYAPQAAVRRALAASLLIAISVMTHSSAAFSQGLPDAKQQEQDSSAQPEAKPDEQKEEKAEKQEKQEKRGSFIIAPIPISSPAFGSGLFLIAGYVFKFNQEDAVSPPSWVGAAGAFTNNGTRALALGTRLYLKENKYQTTIALMKGRANLDFSGIGRIPGREAVVVPLSLSGEIFFGELMRNIGRHTFIGPRYQFRRLAASINNEPRPGGFQVPEIDLKSNSAALGLHLQRDTRNSTFYPTRGTLLDFTADFFDQSVGSRREYQSYKLAYNGFREVAKRQVFAYRAMGCSANGSVPFYDLCLYGFNSDVRGYTTGEFQNRRMFAAQAEYRIDWRKRLGFVGFAGVGGVARNWSDFRMDGLLPGGGAGLRFKLDKKNHINYRVDIAFGREGRTLSIGVGEAF
ncbi:MAG: BamA/TamA family outer membrane protein [Acidobacteria bacterium]|nr:BamA/TamA family outer membrane protein [Acidobacteriota bacterium]